MKRPDANNFADAAELSCSLGWFITGYYTPDESEFTGDLITITVKDFGDVQFSAGFLKHVRVEGWGLTEEGWFLGWDRAWIKNDAALNALGLPLAIGSLAVDRSVVPMGTKVAIPELPAPWNNRIFTADDTGGAIVGRHLDVYCGAGPAAHAQTFKLTGDNRKVCLG